MVPKLYRKRQSIIQSIRSYLSAEGFFEVETPILAHSLIPESNITLMETEFYREGGAKGAGSSKAGEIGGEPLSLYLLPSPEYYMKQLIAQGWGSIFQFARSFRNEEPASPYHHYEFTMLEYYGVEYTYMDAMQLTEDMIAWLLRKHGGDTSGGTGANLALPAFQRMSMAEAFGDFARIDLIAILSEQHGDETSALKKACANCGIVYSEEDSWEVLFHRLFLNRVEPHIIEASRKIPLFLYNYPAQLPSLSLNNGLWTERWELYMQGVEIANCYTEERSRLEVEHFCNQEIAELDRQGHSIRVDANFAEICSAMPPCSGTAIGLDRLLMFLCDCESIQNLMPMRMLL